MRTRHTAENRHNMSDNQPRAHLESSRLFRRASTTSHWPAAAKADCRFPGLCLPRRLDAGSGADKARMPGPMRIPSEQTHRHQQTAGRPCGEHGQVTQRHQR